MGIAEARKRTTVDVLTARASGERYCMRVQASRMALLRIVGRMAPGSVADDLTAIMGRPCVYIQLSEPIARTVIGMTPRAVKEAPRSRPLPTTEAPATWTGVETRARTGHDRPHARSTPWPRMPHGRPSDTRTGGQGGAIPLPAAPYYGAGRIIGGGLVPVKGRGIVGVGTRRLAKHARVPPRARANVHDSMGYRHAVPVGPMRGDTDLAPRVRNVERTGIDAEGRPVTYTVRR